MGPSNRQDVSENRQISCLCRILSPEWFSPQPWHYTDGVTSDTYSWKLGPPHYMTWKSPTLTFSEIPERWYGTRRQRQVWPAALYDLFWIHRPGSLTVPSFSERLQYRILAKRAQEFSHTWICVLTALHSAFLSMNSTPVGTALLLSVKVIMTNLYATGNVRLNITYRRFGVPSGKGVTYSEWVFIVLVM